MRPMLLVVIAIAAVLCGAPSLASATDTGGVAGIAGDPNIAPAADTASWPAGLTFGPVAIAVGIGGIVAMALFAWLVPLARRRLRKKPRLPRAGDHAESRRTAAEEQVTAALHRRTLRRGRVRLEEDPIIASMGVGSASRREPGVSRARRVARRSPPT